MVLGIETSCDDTGASLFDGRKILSNVISTQLVHRRFGGVVPELASRSHLRTIVPVIRAAIDQAGVRMADVTGIAVTFGPGLAGSLLVGLSVAKGLSLSLGIPFVGVNHLEGHIWANAVCHPDLQPPFVVLIASGGHTQLVHVPSWGKFRTLGKTRDDAAGEAFDKVSKFLDLGYPGGPFIEAMAKRGDASRIRFPRAVLEEESCDFSFSGLKTAVINHVRNLAAGKVQDLLPDIAAGFQEAVIDVLVLKTIKAVHLASVSTVCLAGGVAVNRALQERMSEASQENGFRLLWPSPEYCTDNAGMIAKTGHFYLSRGDRSSFSLSPEPSLNL
jgi:N6-L-threonylcarbamoyladenine synthase